jgi:hypothetical protein
LVSTVSLLALTVPGTVLAQRTPAPETVTPLPEVRVIATTPASAVSSPHRARAAVHHAACDRQCARDRQPATGQCGPDLDRPRQGSSADRSADDFRGQFVVGDRCAAAARARRHHRRAGQQLHQDLRCPVSPRHSAPRKGSPSHGGIRVNEAFGDTVNQDDPTNAIDRADVW